MHKEGTLQTYQDTATLFLRELSADYHLRHTILRVLCLLRRLEWISRVEQRGLLRLKCAKK